MPEVGERLDKVEERLGGVEQRLGTVETGLKELRGEVNGLRILGEKNAEDIKKIVEVQSHHGEKLDEHSKKLDEIAKAVTPIGELRDFILRVAPNHELRIQALEKHTGIPS